MKNETVNVFLKGCITDLDKVNTPQEYWTFPTLNIRVINKDGQGYVVTPMVGNTKFDNNGDVAGDQGEEFMLTEGFIPIGCCDINGVVYIASVNETTGEGEIGCFPSPSYASVVPIMQRYYRPLNNYDLLSNGTPGIFRTTLFAFDSRHQIDMFARKDYDDSVNLYLCDHLNRNRVINSGFTQDGEATNRLYTPICFQTYINQYPITNATTKLTLGSITAPGSLLCGNYFFFARYLTHDYNPTDIVAESGPCQVYSGASFDATYIGATIATVEGGSMNDDSGKQVKLHLENLNTSYKYLKISWSRYYSGMDDIIQHENKDIIFNFEITGPTMDITINGYETAEVISDAVLLKKYPEDIICKSHVDVEDRYFGANWKNRQRHHQDLIDFAQLVYPEIGLRKIYMPGLNDTDSGPMNYELGPQNNGYKDYYLTNNGVGYFRSETYIMGLIYEFTDGVLSDMYPTLGIDAYAMANDIAVTGEWNNYFAGIGSSAINNIGLIRFPKNNNYWKYFESANSYASIMHPIFRFNKAFDWVNQTVPEWFKENVRSVYVVRAERNKNLQYQGYSMATAKPCGSDALAWYTSYNSSNGEGSYTLPYPHGNGFPVNSNPASSTASDPDLAGVDTGWGIAYNDEKHVDSNIWRQKQYSAGEGHHHSYKKDHHFPFWKGFAPAHWWKKNCLSSEGRGQHAECNINYMTRLYLDPGYLAFYSFDFLFRQINDISNVKFFEVQARVTPDTDYGYFNSHDEHIKGGLGAKENPMLIPRAYLIDVRRGYYTYGQPGYWDYYDPSDTRRGLVDDVSKIGEGRFVTPTSLIESNGKFLNSIAEQMQNPADAMWYITDMGGWDRDNMNQSRSAVAAKYIGWYNKFSDAEKDEMWRIMTYYDMNHSIVNFYRKDPRSFNSQDLFNMYNPQEDIFYIISDPIDVTKQDELIYKEGIKVFRGDCFVQRTYFKQRYWNGSNFGSSVDHKYYDLVGLNEAETDNPDNDSASPIEPGSVGFFAYFSHGLLFGTVLESENNTAMRTSGDTTSYFPKNYDAFKFAKLPYNTTGIESLMLNKGYNRTLSTRGHFHYIKNLPALIVNRENRIRHSARHINGSFVDGYRDIDIMSYRDFESKNGPIISIRTLGQTLYSIQQDGIIQHYTGEQQVKTPTSAGDTIIGTGPILSQQFRHVANFGSQHQWSVRETPNGIYGVDWKKRVIWKIGNQSSEVTGSIISAGMNLSLTKMTEQWLNDLCDEFDFQTDIVNEYPDNPVNGLGIVTGYDPKFKQVYFTFLRNNRTKNLSRTIVFDEILDTFTTEVSYTPTMYAKTNSDFFSVSKLDLGGSTKYFNLHDVGENCLWMNGVLREMQLSIIVNGKGGQEDTSQYTKMFDSHEVHAPNQVFSAVYYETENQRGVMMPFYDVNRFWLTPEHLEQKWKFPIMMKSDAADDVYFTNSEMRGTYLKTTLIYQQQIPTFVKSIKTVYQLSYV